MGKSKKKKGKMSQAVVRENIQLYLLMLPVFLLIIVFCYGPMFGLVISFQDYMPGSPFWGEGVEWVGLTHFKRFVEGKYFGRLIKNTLVLSGLNLLFGFTAPILFALLIDQIKRLRFKKIAQTASYMPYFISTVVVAGMVISFIDQGGLISNFLSAVFGLPNQNWRDQAPAFPAIYTITNVWKGFGFGSILYISSITSIDQSQYESARIDGANRGQQCWYITLPGIKNIIAINDSGDRRNSRDKQRSDPAFIFPCDIRCCGRNRNLYLPYWYRRRAVQLYDCSGVIHVSNWICTHLYCKQSER